ncbi:MAG TPA: glutamine-hydrolyzing GMP synthase, partial [Casimicrobiaceae bacterium]|nr:glutamine-hydrolyzing GMP synthase [Casimicrobiaceae bacterium]
MTVASHCTILILDFGAQYTQLIARRVRELGVYCEIHPSDITDAQVRDFRPRGVILSGGPESVTDANPPKAPEAVFTLGVPVLGICYGMQTMAQQLGGEVIGSSESEFGYAEVIVNASTRLLDGLADRRNPSGQALLDVWMSHGDSVARLPPGFTATAATPAIPYAAMSDEQRRFYGVQFHPEVTHTTQGTQLLERFVREICGSDALWSTGNII